MALGERFVEGQRALGGRLCRREHVARWPGSKDAGHRVGAREARPGERTDRIALDRAVEALDAAPEIVRRALVLPEPSDGLVDHPNRADIISVLVGTDPNLALTTRKGTGFYKVPSLKGVWYRSLFNHDGSVTTLEEWLDPARLRQDFVPPASSATK